MIQIQVGECGNQIGMNHWAKLLGNSNILQFTKRLTINVSHF